MNDKDDVVKMAYAYNHLREPVLRSAFQAVRFPPGSQGLDAGCGAGLQAVLLAEAVGSGGHVTGLDLSPELLVHAENVVKKAGLSEQVSFREGSITNLPFADNAFDWAWSMDLVGYAPIDPLPCVKELVRVVKPGGIVAILAWSSETLLPGYPLLEARLKATRAGIAPFAADKEPESHFLRTLGWFREAGLQQPAASTFAGDAFAPLSGEQRCALEALFEMRWPGVESELTQEDWSEYQRLCLPESTDYMLDQPDYYAFFTYSMFRGVVASRT